MPSISGRKIDARRAAAGHPAAAVARRTVNGDPRWLNGVIGMPPSRKVRLHAKQIRVGRGSSRAEVHVASDEVVHRNGGAPRFQSQAGWPVRIADRLVHCSVQKDAGELGKGDVFREDCQLAS